MLILTFIFVYVICAVAPAIYLMKYVYRLDRVEGEPRHLLKRLIFLGVLAGFIAGILEGVAEGFLNLAPFDKNSAFYIILLSFLVIGTIEEGMKYLLMGKATWRNPAFNYRFDGIVYSVYTSLGFAAMENIIYALGYGPTVLISRAFLSIPGHCAFAVVFGIYYGKAKKQSEMGDDAGARRCILTGYLLSVFFHGFYDACALIGSGKSTLLFLLVVVVIYYILLKVVKREARTDEPV